MEINIFRHSRDAVTLEAGEVLFQEGDTGDSMFAVAEGEVELAHSGHVVDKIGPGGILGEMALIDAAPRSATATATQTSRIVRVDQQHFTYLVHEHPTFALQVMTVMAERLRRANG
jgi:CRP/FNR family cyclic AMP-dependent transcriptional regulator